MVSIRCPRCGKVLNAPDPIPQLTLLGGEIILEEPEDPQERPKP